MSTSDDSVLDVAIIGAGISGINTAYRVQEAVPNAKYQVLEGRKTYGGTWSFFKYPGLRSDSDLFSFGFAWNTWSSDKVIADAAAIMSYLGESIKKTGIDKHIQYEHKLKSLNWNSSDQLWELSLIVRGQQEKTVRARWVVFGTGYYDYEKALPTVVPGLDNFRGKIVHPQFWPEDLDVTGKKVAIIGSGATAITILPNIADKAERVTVVQRSPSYISSLPARDKSVDFCKRYLPLTFANWLMRVKYLVLSYLFFNFCQAFPKRARELLYGETRKQLPKNISLEPHFTPAYGPWDQRLCLCPDGDFFAALRSGKGNIATGHIETVTEKSIILKDGAGEVDADIIVTATGLKILVGGGAKVTLDGKAVSMNEKMLWKGCMMQDMPNIIAVIGYSEPPHLRLHRLVSLI
jgi:cation diffusion facilitator CzcD-associated flavoprotein CzcO